MSNLAALDCGTNSTRLLITNTDGVTLQREMRITRLGEGVDRTGELATTAMARSLDVLATYAGWMKERDVHEATLVATSAVRDARNGQLFLDRAAAETGATVALLSGDEEAALSFEGATHDLQPSDLVTMIVDIGGGSTELAARVEGELVAHSMQLGCVRVAERALGPGVVTPEGVEIATTMIDAELDRALSSRTELATLVGQVRLVGLAGTVATLAQLDAALVQYNRAVVHHREISLDSVRKWRSLLAQETPEQRLAHPGMVPGREDVLVGGLLILESVMERFRCPTVLSSESDILDGLILRLQRSKEL